MREAAGGGGMHMAVDLGGLSERVAAITSTRSGSEQLRQLLGVVESALDQLHNTGLAFPSSHMTPAAPPITSPLALPPAADLQSVDSSSSVYADMERAPAALPSSHDLMTRHHRQLIGPPGDATSGASEASPLSGLLAADGRFCRMPLPTQAHQRIPHRPDVNTREPLVINKDVLTFFQASSCLSPVPNIFGLESICTLGRLIENVNERTSISSTPGVPGRLMLTQVPSHNFMVERDSPPTGKSLATPRVHKSQDLTGAATELEPGTSGSHRYSETSELAVGTNSNASNHHERCSSGSFFSGDAMSAQSVDVIFRPMCLSPDLHSSTRSQASFPLRPGSEASEEQSLNFQWNYFSPPDSCKEAETVSASGDTNEKETVLPSDGTACSESHPLQIDKPKRSSDLSTNPLEMVQCQNDHPSGAENPKSASVVSYRACFSDYMKDIESVQHDIMRHIDIDKAFASLERFMQAPHGSDPCDDALLIPSIFDKSCLETAVSQQHGSGTGSFAETDLISFDSLSSSQPPSLPPVTAEEPRTRCLICDEVSPPWNSNTKGLPVLLEEDEKLPDRAETKKTWDHGIVAKPRPQRCLDSEKTPRGVSCELSRNSYMVDKGVCTEPLRRIRASLKDRPKKNRRGSVLKPEAKSEGNFREMEHIWQCSSAKEDEANDEETLQKIDSVVHAILETLPPEDCADILERKSKPANLVRRKKTARVGLEAPPQKRESEKSMSVKRIGERDVPNKMRTTGRNPAGPLKPKLGTKSEWSVRNNGYVHAKESVIPRLVPRSLSPVLKPSIPKPKTNSNLCRPLRNEVKVYPLPAPRTMSNMRPNTKLPVQKTSPRLVRETSPIQTSLPVSSSISLTPQIRNPPPSPLTPAASLHAIGSNHMLPSVLIKSSLDSSRPLRATQPLVPNAKTSPIKLPTSRPSPRPSPLEAPFTVGPSLSRPNIPQPPASQLPSQPAVSDARPSFVAEPLSAVVNQIAKAAGKTGDIVLVSTLVDSSTPATPGAEAESPVSEGPNVLYIQLLGEERKRVSSFLATFFSAKDERGSVDVATMTDNVSSPTDLSSSPSPLPLGLPGPDTPPSVTPPRASGGSSASRLPKVSVPSTLSRETAVRGAGDCLLVVRPQASSSSASSSTPVPSATLIVQPRVSTGARKTRRRKEPAVKVTSSSSSSEGPRASSARRRTLLATRRCFRRRPTSPQRSVSRRRVSALLRRNLLLTLCLSLLSLTFGGLSFNIVCESA